MCVYLIYKHAPLGWFAVQREDVQVSSGRETRLHHGNQGLLRDTCDLGPEGQMSVINNLKAALINILILTVYQMPMFMGTVLLVVPNTQKLCSSTQLY